MIAYGNHTELNARVAALVGVDMLELNAQVHEASVRYERLKASVEMLEHGRKALISRLIEQFRGMYPNDGENRLENRARASDQYKDYLETIKREKNKLADAQAEYFRLRNHQETVQLQLAFARSEMYLERG